MEIRERILFCCQATFPCFDKQTSNNTPVKRKEIVIIKNDHATEHTPRVLPPIPLERQVGYVYIALYDYTARTEEDISFNAGDKLEVLDKSAGDWWYAKALTGVSANKQGYLPANYVAPVESLDAEP